MMKKSILAIASLLFLFSCSGDRNAASHLPKAADYGRLGDVGRELLLDFRDFSPTAELNSVMVLKGGEILEEYYSNCCGPDFRNICWSATKTFTSTAVGLAVDDGLLNLDSRVVDILDPSMLPETVSDTLASLTVYNLLRMSSGLRSEPSNSSYFNDTNSTRSILEKGFQFSPGERFNYNSFNTHLLSIMVSRVTGKNISEYLKERIFNPLGITDYYWDRTAEGYDIGGFGLYINTESLAKMGQLYLQKGEWEGKQLISSEWIAQAMSPQIYQKGEPDMESDGGCGYGYQMWCNTRGGAARFDGAYGQWVMVCPEKDAVIVITQHNDRTSHAIKSVWKMIYDRI